MGKKAAIISIIAVILILAAAVYVFWPMIKDTVYGENVEYNYKYEESKDFIWSSSTMIPIMPEDGKTFVIVRITEKNIGLDSYTPKITDVKVKGSDGNVYGAHMQYSIEYDSSNASLKNLGKGETTSFKVVYQMPKGVTIEGSEWNATWPKGVYNGSV